MLQLLSQLHRHLVHRQDKSLQVLQPQCPHAVDARPWLVHLQATKVPQKADKAAA